MTTAPESDLLQPPSTRLDPITWLRKNLFDTWLNTGLTLISMVIVYWAGSSFLTWAVGEANWAVIPANLKVLMSGTYPSDQLWRVWLVLGLVLWVVGVAGGVWQGILLQYTLGTGAVLGLLALVPLGEAQPLLGAVSLATFVGIGLGWKRSSLKPLTIGIWTFVLPIALVILLRQFGEANPAVSPNDLSGLLLTIMFALGALIIAFPIGILLALGRTNQNLPVIKAFCTVVVEFVRGIPLTTILFAAWLLVPLLLGGITVNLFIRAEIGFILFTSAYIAEDIRGGLQSIPRGQWEAARAVGLNPYQITTLIILPQALRVAIPSLVNEFLTLFKDTSLVVIIGAVELLEAGSAVFGNADWLGTQKEVLFFVGLIYFIFCYGMAYAAKHIEKQIGLGVR